MPRRSRNVYVKYWENIVQYLAEHPEMNAKSFTSEQIRAMMPFIGLSFTTSHPSKREVANKIRCLGSWIESNFNDLSMQADVCRCQAQIREHPGENEADGGDKDAGNDDDDDKVDYDKDACACAGGGGGGDDDNDLHEVAGPYTIEMVNDITTLNEPKIYSEDNKKIKKSSYLWNIGDLTLKKSALQKCGQIGKSVEFTSKNNNDKNWRIDFYPWSHTSASKRFSKFQLIIKNTDSADHLKFLTHMSIINSTGEICVCINTTNDSKLYPVPANGNLHFNHYIKLDDIMDTMEKLTSNDCLKILIEIEQLISNESANSQKKNPESQHGTSGFFLNERFSDVVVDFNGTEFKAHRIILAMKSPVLSNMLDYDINKKSKNNRILIKDVDPDVGKKMLEYIYTEMTPSNIDNLVDKLLIAAHKYQINKLKTICMEHMVKKINQNNAIKLLVFSHNNDAQLLKVSIIDFIKNNLALLNSSEFKELELKHSPLAFEVMRKFLPI